MKINNKSKVIMDIFYCFYKKSDDILLMLIIFSGSIDNMTKSIYTNPIGKAKIK